MDVKQFAPVIIPTLNRYEHFKRCLESLEKCTSAELTDVYVALDYPPTERYIKGWMKIDNYLAEKEKSHGFNKLIVVRREKNYGVGHYNSNGNLLIREIICKYPFYIETEDDNEFSPCFLDFMNKALEKYKDNPHVFSISGYNQESFYSDDRDVVFIYDNSAWGQGFWSNREMPKEGYLQIVLSKPKNIIKIWKTYPILLKLSLSLVRKKKFYGDALYTIKCICEELYQIRPSLSLVRNLGNDGSGLHSGVSEKFSKQRISDKLSFEIPDIPVARTCELDKMVYENMMPSSLLKRFWLHTKILLDIIVFYFTK